MALAGGWWRRSSRPHGSRRTGGATLAASLFSEGLVDELMLKVNPVAPGSGIPLFSAATGRVDLGLGDSRMFACGVALLRYRVKS